MPFLSSINSRADLRPEGCAPGPVRPLTHLILLSGTTPTVEEQRLVAFASAMGISTKSLSVRDGSVPIQNLLDEFQPGTYCLAIEAATLALIGDLGDSGRNFAEFVDQRPAALLVFGCTDSTAQIRAVSRLASGAVSGISPLGSPSARFGFPREAKSLSRQLAGLSFSGGHGEAISVFQYQDSAPAAQVIMSANEQPVFVRMDRGSCELFLLSAPLPDLDEPLDRVRELQDHYHRLIPALIFLRHNFGKSCWHGPESTARLIIDDPLLTRRYGFLDHSVLAKSMERGKYGTSIAFIPWNYWRTSRRNSSRLLDKTSNLTICIHGCDHTNKEFETQDSRVLARKARLALRRMEAQRERTGAEFERVMVFPQGLFSSASMAALRASNYLAVINTTCFPVDVATGGLKVGDLLQPAVTRYSGLPIFQRRYPRRLFDFAFDLFLGRPAFVVEHHDYFRDGCETWEEFAAALYKLDPALSWPTLTDQLTRSCRKRNLSDGSEEIRFYTRRFEFVTREPGSGRFLLSKAEPDSRMIEKVAVDGASVPFAFEKGLLRFEVHAEPGQIRNVEVVDREYPYRPARSYNVVYNTGILLRRRLSEFRDNTLSRHGGLLKIAKNVARKMNVTGDA